MRFRAPRFTLLLTGLVALAALAIVLTGGSGPGTTTTAPPPASGPTSEAQQACIRTEAQARDTARGTVAATGRATLPMKVSQTVVGPRAAVTVTRGGSFTARVRAGRHLAVTERAVATARACARGPSLTAAKGLAVRRAYALARIRARAQAAAGAQRGLRALERRTYPLVQAAARAAAARRARAFALAARPALILAARREASRKAGAG
jgi:hypothetical protein